MKKFYSTLALACAVGFSAVAATPAAEKKAMGYFDNVQYLSNEVAYFNTSKKAPQKVATPIEDIEGFYAVDYNEVQEGWGKTTTTATIEVVDDAEITITLEPFCSQYSNIKLAPLTASYDAATGTITMKVENNTSLGTYTDSKTGTKYNVDLAINLVTPIPNDPNGRNEWTPLEEITGVVNADGTIQFGDANTMFGFALVEKQGSYVGGFRNAKFVAPDYFKFEAAEWDNAGEALFTEDWMNRFLTGDDAQFQLKPRNIQLMKNKENPNLFLVENPFKVNNWMNEDPTADGYLVFSLKNNKVVPMRPLTSSGLWVTMEEGGFPEDMYIYNLAGDLVYNQGATEEEALNLFVANELTPSSYDEATKTVTLTNILFGTSADPGASYQWSSDKFKGASFKIKADGFTGGSGAVSDILDDSNNGVKRYFNLQGVEIAQPVAGEIVIVKEGNKTSKTIVR